MDRKQLELESLLEITQAINSNMPEESLYKIFYFSCISHLSVTKLALFVNQEEKWECKVQHKTNQDYKKVPLSKKLNNISDITIIDSFFDLDGFEEFGIVIPVKHEDKLLAYVFANGVGNIEMERDSQMSFIQTLANIIMVAIVNKRLVREQLKQEALKKEMEIARTVQHMLLPKSLPNDGDINVDIRYIPHRSVGGDYYDYVKVGEHNHFICIADVAGKGVPAALMMSNFQASLRTLIRQTTDITYIVKELNHILMENAQGQSFITFFGGVYNSKERILTYINAGHNAPFLCAKGELLHLKEGTTVLGAFPELPFITEGKVEISPKSLLFAFTDGLTEVFNEEGEEFGDERIEKYAFSNQQEEVVKLNQNIFQLINDFRGTEEFRDDLTLLACRFK